MRQLFRGDYTTGADWRWPARDNRGDLRYRHADP
jgi:hypothetical protein